MKFLFLFGLPVLFLAQALDSNEFRKEYEDFEINDEFDRLNFTYGDTTYYISNEDETGMFFDCFYFCRNEINGVSIKFETEDEWAAVSKNMIELDLIGTYFWTYGKYDSFAFIWEWDPILSDPFTFTVWDTNANEPNDYLNTPLNAHVYFDPLYGWYDGVESELLRCVCEV